MEIRIKDEFIKLGQALKLAVVVEDGVEAKYAINDGLVLVNGEVENRVAVRSIREIRFPTMEKIFM